MLLVMTTFACDQKVVTCLCEMVVITDKKEKITITTEQEMWTFFISIIRQHYYMVFWIHTQNTKQKKLSMMQNI